MEVDHQVWVELEYGQQLLGQHLPHLFLVRPHPVWKCTVNNQLVHSTVLNVFLSSIACIQLMTQHCVLCGSLVEKDYSLENDRDQLSNDVFVVAVKHSLEKQP